LLDYQNMINYVEHSS